MSVKKFLDTNVLFYACDSSDPHKQAIALQLIADLSAKRTGVLSTQVLGEFFHSTVVRRKLLSAATAEKIVQDYNKTFSSVPIHFDLVRLAMNIHQKYQTSYWDSLIVAAASDQGCAEILSEDLNDNQIYNGVRVVNPFLVKTKS